MHTKISGQEDLSAMQPREEQQPTRSPGLGSGDTSELTAGAAETPTGSSRSKLGLLGKIAAGLAGAVATLVGVNLLTKRKDENTDSSAVAGGGASAHPAASSEHVTGVDAMKGSKALLKPPTRKQPPV